jgi:hypothetical protein
MGAPVHYYLKVGSDGRVMYSGHVRGQTAPAVLAAAGHTEVTKADHDKVRAGGGWTFADGTLTAVAAVPPALPDAVAAAIRQIDRRAEQLRSACVTPGMAALYGCKEAEARAVLAQPPGQPVDMASCPLLAAEVGVTGTTIYAVARVVLDRATKAHAKTGAIEAVRLRAKAAVRSAASVDALQLVLRGVVWPS